MSKYPFLIGIMFVMLITSCSDEDPQPFHFEVNQQNLLNTWIHEWDGHCKGKLMVFNAVVGNPEEFELWRFRNRLQLFADGSATYTVATPIDPHLQNGDNTVNGIWTFDPVSNTLLILDPGGEIYFSFKIKVVTRDRLIMWYQEIATDEDTL